MTEAEARAIWDQIALRGEGWLDAQARRERDGPTLTADERLAAEVLWDSFIAAMKAVAKAGSVDAAVVAK